MEKKWIWILAGVLAAVFMAGQVLAISPEDVPRISIEETKKLMDDPNVVIIDARADSDWNKSDIKITGAVREAPGDVKTWASKYDPEKTLIIYCA